MDQILVPDARSDYWSVEGSRAPRILAAAKPALFGRLNTEKKILVVIIICLLKEAGFGLVLEGKVGRQGPHRKEDNPRYLIAGIEEAGSGLVLEGKVGRMLQEGWLVDWLIDSYFIKVMP